MKQPRSRTRSHTVATLVLMLAFVSTAGGQTLGQGVLEALAAPDTEYVYIAPDAAMLSETFTGIAEAVGPSVVTVTSRTTYTAIVPDFPSDPFGGFRFDPFSPDWRGLYSKPREQEFVREGLGSGVIVSSDGYIVSNHHVVGMADDLEVILTSGERYEAELVGTDPRTDLAIIRIPANGLAAADFGRSRDLRVGEWVLAIGSPFALSQTVTQGIVSYLGRSNVGLSDFENYIQTDAAINPGNSGGALVNLQGELVGINTAIASRTGGYQGVGFAIPVDIVQDVMKDLIDHGYVMRGWLGVVIQDLSPGLARQFDLTGESVSGILVSDILPDTPAEGAGLRRGDIILQVDGEPTRDVALFRSDIAALDPGTRVELLVFRDGQDQVMEITLGQRPDEEAPVERTERTSELGWRLRELDRESARQLGEPDLEGVLVVDVTPSGDAARSGLFPGDVILEVGREPVAGVAELESALVEETGEVLLLVWRQGTTLYLVIES